MLYPSRCHGITLIEILVVIALLTTSLMLAIPSLAGFWDRTRLKGAAAQLSNDLRLARTEAVQRNTTVRWTWYPQAQGSCYLLHTAQANQCTCTAGVARCGAQATLIKAVHWKASERVALQATVRSIGFDPRLGTSTPAARLHLGTPAGLGIDHVVNVMGRVRSCAGPYNLLGLPVC